MKLEQIPREIVSDGSIGKAVKATVHASRKVFDMFSDNTYAKIKEAIPRELVANGIDAQRLNGNDRVPVRVHLPTELEPMFMVSDIGPGMSDVFIRGDANAMPPIESKFMAFTNGSTKDGNDDDIGGFGIGSKSPLGYVDQYTLRVVHEGILSVYTLFRDEDGIPSIILQAQTTTDEHSGVQVSFPVELADIDDFHAAAQLALQYFNPLPIVENGTLVAPDYQYVAPTWAMRTEAGPLGVIMGGVRYPVVTSSLSYALRMNTKLSPLLEYGLDLTLPIGAVPIAMSREQLRYPNQTSEVIETALVGMIDDVIATFSTMFDQQPSLWDAAQMLDRESPETGMTPRGQLLASNARYRGEKLERYIEYDRKPAGYEDRVWMIETLVGKRRRTVGSSKWETPFSAKGITPGRIGTVIIDDLPVKPKSKTLQRIREYVEDHKDPKNTLVYRVPNGDVTRALAALHNPSDYVLTSSMPEPITVRKASKNKTRPRVRMFEFDGVQRTGFSSVNPNPRIALSDYDTNVTEVPYAVQPSSGILVTLESFRLPDADRFYKNMASGLIGYDEIVFCNRGDAAKIKDSFVDFFVEHDKRLKRALAAYPDLPARIALSGNSDLKDLFLLRTFVPDVLTPAQAKRPFGRIVKLYDKYVRSLDNVQRRLAPFIEAKLPAGVNPRKLVADFKEQQPDAALLFEIVDVTEPPQLALLVKNL